MLESSLYHLLALVHIYRRKTVNEKGLLLSTKAIMYNAKSFMVYMATKIWRAHYASHWLSSVVVLLRVADVECNDE